MALNKVLLMVISQIDFTRGCLVSSRPTLIAAFWCKIYKIERGLMGSRAPKFVFASAQQMLRKYAELQIL